MSAPKGRRKVIKTRDGSSGALGEAKEIGGGCKGLLVVVGRDPYEIGGPGHVRGKSSEVGLIVTYPRQGTDSTSSFCP